MQFMRKYNIYFFLFFVVLIISVISIVNVRKSDQKLAESIEAARLISGAHLCMSARYAYLMLQTINFQKSDCFICSASGIPPLNCINDEGQVTPFSNFEMKAYIISGSPIRENTIPLSMTIFGTDSEEEEISIDAKISPITENFYTAEFLLPRDKLPTYEPALIDIKCGTGGKYTYSVFVGSERINPHIFMNDSNIDALSKSSE
ncbi:MAG: hypothetical protein IKC90_06355 [Akkermansia sp.]|nr:hypothetical protein [Akkermansia sp.]MBR7109643.1 hypothetical protein [Akkermansia sp.]